MKLDGIQRPQAILLFRNHVEDAASLFVAHLAPLPLHDLVGAKGTVEVAHVGELYEESPNRVNPMGRLPNGR